MYICYIYVYMLYIYVIYICYINIYVIYICYIYMLYIEYVRATSEWELTNQETRGIESKPL